ncbi:patulin synthase [Physcia stellaris]|nr:patulin synthase [Physcia stellaris]
MFSFALICITLSFQVNFVVSYIDSITGQGLLGSHFGIPFFNASFDYVVVGGGTAGLAIATRLAQNSSNSVAVIEAGGWSEFDNGNLTAIPADAGYWIGKSPLSRNPLIDWEIFTEPMPGFGGQRTLYTQGKTLGGGSARNSLAFHRSTKQAFRKWADEVGDPSYTFDKLLPYFKRSVNFQPPNNEIRSANATPLYKESAFSAKGGPLRVSYPNYANPYSSWAKLALKELGLKERQDFMSGGLLGYQYTAQSLDRDKKHATGVLVNTGGVEYTLSARKEVIVSAGAFRSPQLLMVSGIGPASTLQQLNIPVLSDLPGVGQNMWDQPLFGPSFNVKLPTHSQLQDPAFAATQISSYTTSQTGLLTNSASDFFGWEKLPKDLRANLHNDTLASLATFPPDWPELELTFPDGYSGTLNDFLLDAPLDGKNYASVVIVLVAPFSRGNVSINSTDTSLNPLVNPNLLGDARDMDLAVQAFRRARQIFNTTALRTITVGSEAFPGANVTSDAQIREMLMKSSNTIYHAAATCAMGQQGQKGAVVDSRARVFGVGGLRVVDASAFPFLPPGHPTSTVYMLAEKIADDILMGT